MCCNEGISLCDCQVSLAALPPGVSLTTAESVLFVGKAVRVLLRPGGAPRLEAPPPRAPDLHAFAAAVRRLQLQATFSQLELDRAVSDVHSKVRCLWARNPAGFKG